jgi:hypothetical protein
MKTLKSLVVAKSIAVAALMAAGLASPTLSHASPNDGVHCRSGYTGTLVNGNFKCTKRIVVDNVVLTCPAGFQNPPLVRIPGIPGDTTNGKDICLAPGFSLNSNDSIPSNFVEGRDFRFISVSPAQAVAARISRDNQEEAALGLPDAGVDSNVVSSVVVVNGGPTSRDDGRITIDLTTFAIP